MISTSQDLGGGLYGLLQHFPGGNEKIHDKHVRQTSVEIVIRYLLSTDLERYLYTSLLGKLGICTAAVLKLPL